MRDLWRFIQERFELKVTIPMTLILTLSVKRVTATGQRDTLLVVVAVWGVLLCLRIADDLLSIASDRQRKPKRGLCCGRINPRRLWWTLGALITLLACICASDVWRLFVLGGWLVWYIVYFSCKKRLWAAIRPFCSNMIFGSLAFFVDNPLVTPIGKAQVWLAIFIYLGVVAHEFTHSVGEDKPPSTAALSPWWAAAGGTLLYLLALLCAAAFAAWCGPHPAFVGLLVVTTAQLSYLCWGLLHHPDQQHARPFYIYGFLFFLLPLCGLLAEQMWSV